jgi:hypothetical protein
MSKFIKILALLVQMFFVLGCKQNNQNSNLKLVPYLNIYKYDAPFDTLLPNGIFVKNLVNVDTSDLNFYIKYGNKSFDSILIVNDGLESSLCARLEYCYSTVNTIALIRQCINSRGMILLSLKKQRKNIENIDPIYLGIKEDLIVSVCAGDGNFENGDSLLITNLDFDKRQYVKINGLNFGDRERCFEKVEIRNGFLNIRYWGIIKDYGPKLLTIVEKIELK